MELKLQDNIKAVVELDGNVVISSEDCMVYENIEDNDAYIFIKNSAGKELKIHFTKK